MARAAVLAIGASSDMFCRASHPPTDIRQSPATFGKQLRLVHDRRNFRLRRLGCRTILFTAHRKQPQPASRHVLIAPSRNDIRPGAKHQVDMVAHDRVRQAIDTEDRRQQLQAVTNPLPPMLVGFARNRIVTTQEGSPDTSTDCVADLNFARVDHFSSRKTSHRGSPRLQYGELLPSSYQAASLQSMPVPLLAHMCN